MLDLILNKEDLVVVLDHLGVERRKPGKEDLEYQLLHGGQEGLRQDGPQKYASQHSYLVLAYLLLGLTESFDSCMVCLAP